MQESEAQVKEQEDNAQYLLEQIMAGKRKHQGLLSSVTMLRRAQGAEEASGEREAKDEALS